MNRPYPVCRSCRVQRAACTWLPVPGERAVWRQEQVHEALVRIAELRAAGRTAGERACRRPRRIRISGSSCSRGASSCAPVWNPTHRRSGMTGLLCVEESGVETLGELDAEPVVRVSTQSNAWSSRRTARASGRRRTARGIVAVRAPAARTGGSSNVFPRRRATGSRRVSRRRPGRARTSGSQSTRARWLEPDPSSRRDRWFVLVTGHAALQSHVDDVARARPDGLTRGVSARRGIPSEQPVGLVRVARWIDVEPEPPQRARPVDASHERALDRRPENLRVGWLDAGRGAKPGRPCSTSGSCCCSRCSRSWPGASSEAPLA